VGLGRRLRRKKSKRQPARAVQITASNELNGSQAEFQPNFADPPDSGTLILLNRDTKKAVAKVSRTTIGKGSGAKVSKEVIEALKCNQAGIDVPVEFEPATRRAWLRHGPGAVRRLARVIGESLIALAGIAVGFLAASGAAGSVLIAIGAISGMAFLVELAITAGKLRSLPQDG